MAVAISSPRAGIMKKGCDTVLYRDVMFYFVMFLCCLLSDAFEDKERVIESVLEDLKDKFDPHSNVWRYIGSVVRGGTDEGNQCPTVILLLHGHTETTSNCFIEMIANATAKLMKSDVPLYWSGKDLECDECGEEQRKKLQKHQVVIVKKLEEFPAKAALKLHFFCDEYDCNFAKAVYFLSLTVSGGEKEPTKAAEETLQKLWPDIDDEVRGPLINRLTTRVQYVPMPSEGSNACNAR